MSPPVALDFSNSPWAAQPIHSERHVRIITVGAGASGLLVAYKLQRSFRNFTLSVYDKNAEVGGTWTENRYPGCACDIPAHNYTFSFFPNPEYSHVYSGSQQIREYFIRFADTFGLGKYVKLRRLITRAEWDDHEGAWKVDIKNLETGEVVREACDFFINATGFLNHWRWPDDVRNLDAFKGDLLHTARWPPEYDLRGKRVGLIGNGSSAIQVLPAIQPEVSHLTTFIRGATWIAPPLGSEGQREYTQEEKEKFKNDPDFYLKYRKEQEERMSGLFAVLLRDSEVHIAAQVAVDKQMRAKFADPQMADLLVPKWSIGCRRFTPGPGYIEALQAPNVEVVHAGVVELTEDGCVAADGSRHTLDTIICATGFNTGYRPSFAAVGLGGRDLRDEWAHDARGYLSLGAAGMPNFFMLIGPNGPAGNGPFIPGIEAGIDYILACVDRWQTENIHSLTPRREAVDDFNDYTDWYMQRTVWSDECSSWYKKHSKNGRVTALWPGSTLHFIEAIRQPRWEDWDIRYRGNRFLWLGNGHSQTEVDEHADLAYYITDSDETEYNSRWKKREALTHTPYVTARGPRKTLVPAESP
ncbi:FAD/NAD(P)-binding domain-containing protein [Auricularia subglabra TFB-10046 SS5]|uniref:FAD/NAD(P)-binding domain-containing protein n=1 Tax=Auricularia subglabra (strain TFB-10046 / SS5) TaxID=717982 RepID=J0WWW4_AURST|nr:FAD/NAD(P)-binding domain-containing protein [Auricularia subglabra TFB-10046 SS5]